MCVAPDPVARLVVGVSQDRGRLDSEAGEGAAEKSMWVTKRLSVLKLTQVGEESILRRSREPWLRN